MAPFEIPWQRKKGKEREKKQNETREMEKPINKIGRIIFGPRKWDGRKDQDPLWNLNGQEKALATEYKTNMRKVRWKIRDLREEVVRSPEGKNIKPRRIFNSIPKQTNIWFSWVSPEYRYDEHGNVEMTFCSRTASKNLEKAGHENVPTGNAENILPQYLAGDHWEGYVGLVDDLNDIPRWSYAGDIMMAGGEFGHRAFLLGNKVYDPYLTGTTNGVPLETYKSILGKTGYKVEGVALYS
jgi:hypothetical protein